MLKTKSIKFIYNLHHHVQLNYNLPRITAKHENDKVGVQTFGGAKESKCSKINEQSNAESRLQPRYHPEISMYLYKRFISKNTVLKVLQELVLA
jgi:hypothetical protein